MRLFHVALTDAWLRSRDEGSYAPPSLAAEGFIHLSTAEQVPPTLRRFFAGATSLTLLSLDGEALGPALRWVEVRHADDGSVGRFPHLHRPITPGEVLAEHAAPSAGDLEAALPALLA